MKNRMKFLHTADWHIGGVPAIGKLLENGLRERENDLLIAFDQILDICIKEEVDTLIIAGDIYESSNPDSTSRRIFSDFLINLFKKKSNPVQQCIIIPGNHDSPISEIKSNALQSQTSLVEELYSSNKNITSSQEISVKKIRSESIDCGIIIVPYTTNMDTARIKIKELYSQYESEVDVFILVGHIEIKEAELGASDIKLKCGVSYQDEMFSHPKMFYAALGHIHKPQYFINTESGCTIQYSGSLVSKDFNEAKEQRRVIVGEISKTESKFKQVLLRDRDFITIDNGEGLEELITDVVFGNIIRLRYKGTKEYIASIKTSEIIERLESMGALQVKINKTVIKDIKETDSDFADSTSLPKACITYITKYADSKEYDTDYLKNISTVRLVQ